MKNSFLENKEKFTNEFLIGLLDNNLLPHDHDNVLYKYLSFDVAKLVLSQKSLKFSSPLLFEDQMELHPDNLDFTADHDLLMQRLQAAHAKKYPDGRPMPYKFTDEEMVNAYRVALEDQRKTSLIFCTSSSCTNQSMWRLYADEGHGICLGFYFPTFYEQFNMTVMHVQYRDNMPACRIFDNNETIRTYELMRWTMTKQTKYAFEEEVRCFIPALFEPGKFPEEGGCLIPFAAIQLREIIFGPEVTPQQKQEIMELLKLHPYDVQKTGTAIRLHKDDPITIRYEI